MSTNTAAALPNWVIPVDEFASLEGWTGGSRPIPEAGYYMAKLDTLVYDDKGNITVQVAFESDDPVANGFTVKNFYHYNVERRRNEPDDKYADRQKSNWGKLKGFVTSILQIPMDYLIEQVKAVGGFTPQLLSFFFDTRKADANFRVYVAFSVPTEEHKGLAGKKLYANGDLMDKADWEIAKGTGKPPEYRSFGNTDDTATNQAATVPGSVTRLAALGGTGTVAAPVVSLPAAGGAVGVGGGIPGATSAFPGLPAAPAGLGIPRA